MVPYVVGAVGCGLCVVVSEPPFAVVDDAGWLVFGFWFEDFAEEAFHRDSPRCLSMIWMVAHG